MFHLKTLTADYVKSCLVPHIWIELSFFVFSVHVHSLALGHPLGILGHLVVGRHLGQAGRLMKIDLFFGFFIGRSEFISPEGPDRRGQGPLWTWMVSMYIGHESVSLKGNPKKFSFGASN